MTSFDYAKTAATALRLIQRFGAPAAVVAKSSTYDPDTGTTVATLDTTPCVACVIDAEKSHIDGTLIQAGHRVALVPPQGISEPKPGYALQWQGAMLQISTVKALAPAGIPVLYELQVR